MKKIICIITTIAMLITNVYAFAGDMELFRYESDEPFEYSTYLEEDFETETAKDGDIPSRFMVYSNTDKAYVPSFGSATVIAKDTTAEDPAELGNKYVLVGVSKTNGDLKAGDAARLGRPFSREISEGVLCVEFDAAIYDDPDVGGEYVHLGLSGRNGNTWFISANCFTGQLGLGVTQSNGLFSDSPLFTPGQWQHYAFELDLTNNTVTLKTGGNEYTLSLSFSGAYLGIQTYSHTSSNMAFDNFHVYTVTPLEEEDGKILYGKYDFENDETGDAPSGFLGSEGSATLVEEVESNKVANLNSPVAAMLKAPAEHGKLSIEFDALTGDSDLKLGVVTADAPNDFSKTLFSLEDGSVFENKDGFAEINKAGSEEAMTYDGSVWNHYKMIVNTVDNMIAFKVNDTLSESVYDLSVLSGNVVSAVVFDSENGGVLIDNVIISRQPNYVKNVLFEDYSGNLSAETDGVSTVTDKIIVEFADKLDFADSGAIEFYNETEQKAVDFECELSDDGYALYITPTDGYFVENNKFSLTIKKTMLNEWLKEMEEDHTVKFTSGSGLMRVFNMAITDVEGIPLDVINPGDRVYLRIEYAKSGTDGEVNGILAYSATDDGELKDLYYENVCLNEFGKNAYMKGITLRDDISFDKVNMFFWDTDTNLPIADKVSVGGLR